MWMNLYVGKKETFIFGTEIDDAGMIKIENPRLLHEQDHLIQNLTQSMTGKCIFWIPSKKMKTSKFKYHITIWTTLNSWITLPASSTSHTFSQELANTENMDLIVIVSSNLLLRKSELSLPRL
jgi:hypothetical protein